MLVTIAIFAKPPRPGRAKTRLVPALGEVGAARLARAFLQDVWALSDRSWARRVLATTEPGDRSCGLPEGIERWDQGGGDLGARVERVLWRGRPAIALGADSPDLPPDYLDAAREALSDADAVFGPAQDGGFYLLGVRHGPQGMLDDLPWSTPDTLSAAEARLRSLGLRTRRIEPWYDVDEPTDLEALLARLSEHERAPRTRAALRELGVG